MHPTSATVLDHLLRLPTPGLNAFLFNLPAAGLIAFLFNVMEEVLPIFASAAVVQGGLGLTPSQLAPSLSFGGVVLMVYALKGFPRLMRCVATWW